jgi:hypothetical protein
MILFYELQAVCILLKNKENGGNIREDGKKFFKR